MVNANVALNFVEVEGEVRIEWKDLKTMSTRRLKTSQATSGRRIWAASSNGKQLVITTKPSKSGAATEFEIMSIESGRCTPIELEGVQFCRKCAWSPDGKLIAFVGSGTDGNQVQTINIVDAATNSSIRERQIGFLGWGNQLQSVDWSPDGSKLAVGGQDGRCEILDSKSLEPIIASRPSAGAAWEVAWHPFDDRIASASSDGTVAIWDASNGQVFLLFQLNEAARELRWSPNGKRLAARLPSSGEIMVWDASEGYRRSQSNVIADHRHGREEARPQIED